MANIPQKPVVNNQQWINGQTKLNQTNLTSGVNQNITNLKTAVDGIIDAFGGPGAEPPSAELLVPITYSELVALRDSSSLVPGTRYRITDYQCTTVTNNTSSAGHQFDIIVEADDASTLNENAYAIQHSGDTYFANSNLEAWKLKYCIDNDTNRFAWADSTNGKGVIYWMKDEFSNECPYDFKNILFTSGGYIYMVYTFACGNSDASIDGVTKQCHSNVIKEYITDNKQSLNFNVFYLNSLTLDCYSNILGNGCHNNTFGGHCHNNTFGNGCSDNTLGDSCYNNSFGNDCGDNIFDENCYDNTFGNNCDFNRFNYSCYNNTLGNYCNDINLDGGCYRNTFGDNCYRNVSGNGCYNNTFGDNCTYNSIGDYCYNNTFCDNCNSNTLYDNCYSNIFGISCSSNTLGDNCYSNTFGNSCYSNNLGQYCNSNIFGNSCQYNNYDVTIDYCQYIIFDNGCSYINLSSEDTGASSSNYLQNVHVRLGVKGTDSTKLDLTVPDRNLPYETDFYLDESGNLKVSRFDIPQTLTAGAGISIENGVISVSYANADEEAF